MPPLVYSAQCHPTWVPGTISGKIQPTGHDLYLPAHRGLHVPPVPHRAETEFPSRYVSHHCRATSSHTPLHLCRAPLRCSLPARMPTCPSASIEPYQSVGLTRVHLHVHPLHACFVPSKHPPHASGLNTCVRARSSSRRLISTASRAGQQTQIITLLPLFNMVPTS